MLPTSAKRIACGLALIVVSTVSWALAPQIGAPAPEFLASAVYSSTGLRIGTLKASDFQTLKLSDFRGKIVVLEWTSHLCPFVRKHYESGNIPRLQGLATGAGAIWLQVLSSAPGEPGYTDGMTAVLLNAYRNAAPSGILLDPEGKLGKLYGAKTTPHIFIIDAQGTLVYKGGIDNIDSTDKADIAKAENYVSEALAAIAAGKKIEHPITKPYGCSVKYADWRAHQSE